MESVEVWNGKSLAAEYEEHGSLVGKVRSSYRGRVKNASNELEIRLASLNRTVGVAGCDAEIPESTYLLGSVGKPRKCSGRFAQRLVWQESIDHLLDVELLRQREGACAIIT
eukprot:6176715-Pleurochrysis_carterae.AAC.1